MLDAQFLVGDILRMLSRDDDRIHAQRTLPFASYSTVTWDLPSGRRKGSVPFLRTTESRCVSLCASEIGVGINSAFSFTAYPNIIPWSPAPPVSTPMAMSPDCLLMLEMTAQVLQSKP